MEMNWVNKQQKIFRSRVVSNYLKQSGQKKCVCFTCGNASEALRLEGLEVIEVGKDFALMPKKWFSMNEIAFHWPGIFDATCGHLPLPLMVEISRMWTEFVHVGNIPRCIDTGSGETLVCLKMAFPGVSFNVSRKNTAATEFNEHAPLNALVGLLSVGATQ